jgi:ribonuclease T1
MRSPLCWFASCSVAVLVTALCAAPIVSARGEVTASAAKPGISQIAAADLPREARETLGLIKRGGPFSYSKDGSAFNNRERLLPLRSRGYYREYTVPVPGARDRGARRIIAGSAGEYYYTDDHYATFRRIRE